MHLINSLTKKGLITPPKFLPDSIQYLTMMGSIAYGVSSDNSDLDIYGFCIPPKEIIFPHLAGEILGFGKQKQRFEQYQQHGVEDKTACGGKGQKYDITVYNIAKYFQLCMDNNPNMIDSLFTPDNCVIHRTKIGDMVRDNRKLFLHKGSWHKFKGYAYSQLHKMSNKKPEGKRKETVEQYGYDVKFAYHIVRLLNEIEQILIEFDLDLQRNREQLKSIRRGEWAEEEIREYFASKERELETAYLNSKLPHSPDEDKIKALLLACLEEHYGNLDQCIVVQDRAIEVLKEIQASVAKIEHLL